MLYFKTKIAKEYQENRPTVYHIGHPKIYTNPKPTPTKPQTPETDCDRCGGVGLFSSTLGLNFI